MHDFNSTQDQLKTTRKFIAVLNLDHLRYRLSLAHALALLDCEAAIQHLEGSSSTNPELEKCKQELQVAQQELARWRSGALRSIEVHDVDNDETLTQ